MVMHHAGHYRIAQRAGVLAGTTQPASLTALARLATPHLVELHRNLGHMSALIVLDRDTTRCLDAIYNHDQLAAMTAADETPTYCLAAGLLFLAFSTESALVLVSRDMPAPSPRSVAVLTWAEDRERLTVIRRQGVAYVDAPPGSVHAAFAVPVLRRDRHVLAALCVADSAARLKATQAQAALRAAAYLLARATLAARAV
jgi:DNA-binding IclR family transcriptional regulator